LIASHEKKENSTKTINAMQRMTKLEGDYQRTQYDYAFEIKGDINK